MNAGLNLLNKESAAVAFDMQAGVFDKIYGDDPAIVYKRNRVRTHLLKELKPGARILELNCGTGEDAVYLSKKGFTVHATDISGKMLAKAVDKFRSNDNLNKLSFENCSFTSLSGLSNKGPFDHIFSNFGGLNCTADLDQVLASLSPLLKDNGKLTLTIISGFCLWETLLIFKGKWKTAFRRFRKGGASAHVEGHHFNCSYYTPRYIKRHLEGFTITKIEGLCIFIPPSYIQGFHINYPLASKVLMWIEDKLKSKWPWNRIGDYFILTAKKNKDYS